MINLQPCMQAILSGMPPFEERVWFDSEMDQLIFLREDVSFRADRVDAYLTLLFHPYEDRLVGIKIKGIRGVFDVLVEALGHARDERIPLREVVAWVMTGAAFSEVADRLAADRRAVWLHKYEMAREVADDYPIPTNLDQIRLAA